MEYLHKFLDEIQSIDIKETVFCVRDNEVMPVGYLNPDDIPNDHPLINKKRFLDLSHYSQHSSDYESELFRLQDKALTDILNLTPEQQTRQLERLVEIENKFDRFWELMKKEKFYQYDSGGGSYPTTFKKHYSTVDLELNVLRRFFNCSKFDKSLSHSPWFFGELFDAVMFKDGFLYKFINDIKKRLNVEPENVDGKINYRGIVIMHYHWGKFDKKQTINEKSINRIANLHFGQNCESKRRRLKQAFIELMDDDKLLHGTHRNATKESKLQYEIIIPLLREKCLDAAKDAESALNKLK